MKLSSIIRLVLGLTFLVALISSLSANEVTLTGALRYQKPGKFVIKENATLGSFIEELGGIIGPECDFRGERVECGCCLYLIKNKEKTRFRFDRDDKKAWATRLEDGDVISIAEFMFIAPDPIPLDKLKFPPLRFAKPKAEQ